MSLNVFLNFSLSISITNLLTNSSSFLIYLVNFSILVCPGSLTNENYCNNSLGWSGCNSVGIQDYGNSTGCLSTSPTFANYVQQIVRQL